MGNFWKLALFFHYFDLLNCFFSIPVTFLKNVYKYRCNWIEIFGRRPKVYIGAINCFVLFFLFIFHNAVQKIFYLDFFIVLFFFIVSLLDRDLFFNNFFVLKYNTFFNWLQFRIILFKYFIIRHPFVSSNLQNIIIQCKIIVIGVLKLFWLVAYAF